MIEGLLHYTWIFIQLSIGYNLLLPLLLFVFYCAFKYVPTKENESWEAGDYAIIVTAYQYTHHLQKTIDSILNINSQNYLVYVVADNCSNVSNLHFNDSRVILLKPETVLASNTRSHLYALNRFRRQHNRVTIIDSDNLVDAEFINELEHVFKMGFHAVQGLRSPKNLDTTYACLDAARDIYYHFYDGKVLFALGSSATLAGSGMAFTTTLYKSFLEKNDIKGAGFDKVLQYEIVKQGFRIAYAEKAVVYDEKTAQTDQLVNQRSRWINTWFKYFSYGFRLIGSGVTSFNWNQTLFGIILLRPPLFLFLIFSVCFFSINVVIGSNFMFYWSAGLLCFIIGFALALMSSNVDRRIYRSLVSIPKFIYYQVLSLVKLSNLNKQPISTRHTHSSELPVE
ncbi:glycosyltransferase [Daejeonella lutea]|uniref:Glycosyltransferase, catalytic subunit of cellulose synthase and poly-beta-1,6-N-acetylglucosamine synthase n=1 Tax=Daejeonella lutea TaxID=572036 RepID=A0A1T5EF99_9SPHI|nr:glycosyltransferase [Daejeonella lutea]SKB82529.1 Glycosyltransferase, catalytic subunit of cellulose synthase and poly-beta-1,6-N-acetylglucosamine synthase [Daejeonella lutea]